MHKALMEMAQNQLDEKVSVEKKKYNWGLMMTVKDGKSNTFPLHPEEQAKIKKLKDGQTVKFKDETGAQVTAARKGDMVHLSNKMSNKKTPVAYSNFTESFERAAWVPESIADEQVEAFMESAVTAVKEGEDTFVFEGKHYKAKSKKEAKKLDPVGKADADIDNDGDVDSSDEYLKNRRKAIKKAMSENDDEDDNDEEMDPTKHVSKKGDMYCVYNKDGEEVAKFDNEEEANAYARKNHDALMGKKDMDEVSYKKAMKSYQKAMGQSKDADTAGDKETGDKKFDQAVKFGRYANKKFQSSRNKKKLVGTLSRQVPLGTLTKEETVEEAAAPGSTAQHGPDASTQDTYDKQMNAGENDIPMGDRKEFVDQHNMEVALDAEAIYKQNQEEAEKALKQTPPRLGDQRNGDTSFVNPIKTEIIDGITKALQQMKTNN